MNELKARLDRIRSRVTSDEFLTGSGLGNEVPFYAFDYPPPEEPRVAAHVDWLVDDLRIKAGLQVGRVDVFALAIQALNKRGLYEKAVAMEATKGVPALLAALRGHAGATEPEMRSFVSDEPARAGKGPRLAVQHALSFKGQQD